MELGDIMVSLSHWVSLFTFLLIAYQARGSLPTESGPFGYSNVNVTTIMDQTGLHNGARLQNVRNTILHVLGMNSTPAINVSAVPRVNARKMLNRYHRISGSDGIPDIVEEGGDPHIYETLLLLAETDPLQPADVIDFHLRTNGLDGKVEMASLMMLLNQKETLETTFRSKRKRQNRDRNRVTLKVYQIFPDNRQRLLATLNMTVKHTRWVKVTLPISVIRTLIINHEESLRLRIVCRGKNRNIIPMLVGRTAKKLRRRQSRRSRSVFSPNSHRREKYNKRWPYLIIGLREIMDSRVIRKRDTACGINSAECCVQRFYVSFKDLGWNDWIISPQGYFANYCSGDCPDRADRDPVPTRLVTTSTRRPTDPPALLTHRSLPSATETKQSEELCCRPKASSGLSLLHYDLNGKIVKTEIPNMRIDECICQ